jgi:2-keto-3-deoxy-L-rhamnonate aldolase RhmA
VTTGELAGIRRRLHEPGPLYLAQMLIPEPAVASILASTGFDFIMVDVEHGPFTLSSLRACVEAFRVEGIPALARTASHSEVEIKQLLDLGLDGVIVPKVESAEEAAAAVRAARYAPEGIRGVSRAVRAARYGLDGVSYVQNANSSIAVLAIIESGKGVENVEEIVGVPGLDGIFVGGDDLSSDLGISGQVDHPAFRAAVDKVIGTTLEAGLKIMAGYVPKTPAEADLMLNHCFLDAMGLYSAAKQALEARRAV